MTTTRRKFLGGTAAGLISGTFLSGQEAKDARRPARIAITLDLEMARNFPKWEDTHWDYEKANLDQATKDYAVEAARRVKANGGRIHFFVVARAIERPDIDWLKEILWNGHAIGNHTYDHVNLLASTPEQTQFRFQREPALIAGKTVPEILRDNVLRASEKIRERLSTRPAGFRTPGGFPNGLDGREDLQKMLRDAGFTWVSSRYPAHAVSKPGTPPTADVMDSILKAQSAAQPYVYPNGLVEIPMSPISDIGAFRNARWPLEHFLEATRKSIEWAIEHNAVFDFLGHPACLNVVDPNFRTIDLICDLVKKSRNRARIETLDQIAASVARK